MQQVVVLAGVLAVDGAVGAHHRGSMGLLGGGPERGEVDLVLGPLADDHIIGGGVPVGLLVVHGKVLDLGHLPLALHPVDVRHGQRGVEVRVLGVGLERAAPARVAVDVHGRAQVDHGALAALLRPDDLAVLGGQGPVPGGGQGDRGRQLRDAGEAVAHPDRAVFLAHGRDAQAGDRGDVEDVRLAGARPGDHVDLVGQGHLGQQHLHPLAHRQGLVQPGAGGGRGSRPGRAARGGGAQADAELADAEAAEASPAGSKTARNVAAAIPGRRRVREPRISVIAQPPLPAASRGRSHPGRSLRPRRSD